MLPKLERTTKGGVDDLLEVGGSVGGAFGRLWPRMRPTDILGGFGLLTNFDRNHSMHIQGTISGESKQRYWPETARLMIELDRAWSVEID